HGALPRRRDVVRTAQKAAVFPRLFENLLFFHELEDRLVVAVLRMQVQHARDRTFRCHASSLTATAAASSDEVTGRPVTRRDLPQRRPFAKTEVLPHRTSVSERTARLAGCRRARRRCGGLVLSQRIRTA